MFIPRLRFHVAVLFTIGWLAGCAGQFPWKNAKQVARERELYGMTADQRIEELRSQARAAQEESADRQVVFVQGLAGRLLGEHDPRVRAAFLPIVAGFDTPTARAICAGGLEDPDPLVRTAACDAWQQIGGEDAVRHLAHRFRADEEIDVRLHALRRLGTLGDEAAIPALAEALEDPDPAVQFRAVASLREVSGRDLGNDVNAWRAWAADPESQREDWSIAEAFRRLF